MSCCDESSAFVPDRNVSRRSLLKGAAVASALVPASLGGQHAQAQGKKVTLAFCSQLLCIIPYEVARAGGHFQKHGLEVELVYTRGGNAAMQALVGGAVDYAATALDVAIQAYAKGADIRRFAVTGRLPLFALATAPRTAAQIQSIKDLEGKTVGISALGNADHALLLFLLKQANADAGKVQFATLGVNLLEALRQGQVDAGLVQEPALTLLRQSGARVLVNAMDTADAQKYLGGNYEFMGVAVRAKEFEQRRTEMTAISQGLSDALSALRRMKPEEIAGALPKELTAGMDSTLLGDIVVRYRNSLYPETVGIDRASAQRVAESLRAGGLLQSGADISKLHDTSIGGG
ncbi:MAG: ABC transporter substrate-binding protein [Rhizobiales bacterium]|nr:ABC transporter substrate-binding protein [Hyphomicrobiales bacterium]